MAVPGFDDLGKAARDIFSKGYHFGLIKLDLKTKTEESIDISAGGNLNQDTGRTFGALETKYKAKDYGLTFTEKWNTDNCFSTEVSVENKLAEGLLMSVDTTFAPTSGQKKAHLKTQYKGENLTCSMDVDLDPAGPIMHGSSVLSHKGWFAGYQLGYDTTNRKVIKNNVAVAYSTEIYELYTRVNGGREYTASLYHKANDDLETGIQLAWSADSNSTSFEIGTKCNVAENLVLRAKVDNSSHLGLSLQQKLHEGVTLTMSTQIDAKNFNQGGHKIGMALELKA